MNAFQTLVLLLMSGSVAARSLHFRQPGRGNPTSMHTGQKFSFRREGGAAAFIKQMQPKKLQRIKKQSRFRGTTAKLALLLDRDPDLVSQICRWRDCVLAGTCRKWQRCSVFCMRIMLAQMHVASIQKTASNDAADLTGSTAAAAVQLCSSSGVFVHKHVLMQYAEYSRCSNFACLSAPSTLSIP
jgi:hypothetical protein